MTGPLIVTPTLTLVTERGGPVPPTEILSRMKKIDPSLGLRWTANWNESNWAVTWEWPESDRRWERVRTEEISRESAYDIIGYLPVDCSVSQAATYIEQHLKSYPKEEISRLRSKVAQWNDVEVAQTQTTALIGSILDDEARQRNAPVNQIVSAPKEMKHRRKA